jgi:hypothetical protein
MVNPLHGCRLLPLSAACVLELINTYLLPLPPRLLTSPDPHKAQEPLLASAMTVFPPSLAHPGPQQQGCKQKYSVVFPRGPDDDGADGLPAALLVEFEEEEVPEGAQVGGPEEDVLAEGADGRGRGKRGRKVGSSPRWDPTIVGPYCRWRSCLDEAVGGQGAGKHVCEVHGEVKRFLDARSAVGSKGQGGKDKAAAASEATRYLPRKPPADSSRRARVGMDFEVLSLLHASSLLQVRTVWGGPTFAGGGSCGEGDCRMPCETRLITLRFLLWWSCRR